jgi:hypothetical protein
MERCTLKRIKYAISTMVSIFIIAFQSVSFGDACQIIKTFYQKNFVHALFAKEKIELQTFQCVYVA